jgi:hypothetical protein
MLGRHSIPKAHRWIVLVSLFAVSLLFGDSFSWGYISTNVTHRLAGGKSERVKFLSNVFGYCASETPTDDIVKDKESELRRRIRAVLGDDNFEITNNYLNGANVSEEKANEKRAQDLRGGAFTRHESWECACAYPARSCR